MRRRILLDVDQFLVKPGPGPHPRRAADGRPARRCGPASPGPHPPPHAEDDEQGRALPQAVVDQLSTPPLSTGWRPPSTPTPGRWSSCRPWSVAAPQSCAGCAGTAFGEVIDETGRLRPRRCWRTTCPRSGSPAICCPSTNRPPIIRAQQARVRPASPTRPPRSWPCSPAWRATPEASNRSTGSRFASGSAPGCTTCPAWSAPAARTTTAAASRYSFRHSFAQRHADGGPVDVVADLMGHRNCRPPRATTTSPTNGSARPSTSSPGCSSTVEPNGPARRWRASLTASISTTPWARSRFRSASAGNPPT